MNITLPLSILRSILFGESGDIHFPKVTKLLSPGVGDLAKVKVLHYEVGELIKEIDKDETFFHVELCTNRAPVLTLDETKTIDIELGKWAEIWLSFEWKESNARRKKFAEHHRVELAERNRKTDLAKRIADELTGKLPESFCQLLAHEIVANYKKHDLKAILENLKVMDIIEQYEKEN